MKKILTLAILAVAAFSAYAQVKVNDANNISISHAGGNLDLLGTIKLKDLANGSLTDSVLTVMPDGRIRMIPRSQLLAGLANAIDLSSYAQLAAPIPIGRIPFADANGKLTSENIFDYDPVNKVFRPNAGISMGIDNTVISGALKVVANGNLTIDGNAPTISLGQGGVYDFRINPGWIGSITDQGQGVRFISGGVEVPGKLGVGTTNPSEKLHVVGKALVTQAPTDPNGVVRKQDLDDAVAGFDVSGKANANGSNATGTWQINISGNSSSATNWGGYPADFTTIPGGAPSGMVGFSPTDGKYKEFSNQAIRDWLGLNNLHASSATNWGGYPADFITAPGGAPSGMVGFSPTDGKYKEFSNQAIRDWLGLSNLHASSATNWGGYPADFTTGPGGPVASILGFSAADNKYKDFSLSAIREGLGMSNLLSLAGGTLTGNLAGTIATFSGNITGSGFVKSGGTSSQFLKADGSVDATTYTIASGGNTFTGIQHFTGSLHDIQLGGTGNGGAIKATLKSDPTNYYSYMTGAAFIQYGGAQRSALTAAGLNLYDADGSHGITLKAADNFTEDWIAKFQDTTGTIAYLHNIPVAGTDYVTPSNLANYITTNTNQTGLSGGKDWSGTHAWTLGGDDNTLINLSGVTVQSASTFVQVMSNYVIAQDNSIGLSAKLTPVSIDFTDNNSSNTLQLNFPSSLAANRTVALQDASGTIALTKDIPKMFNATASGDGSATTFSFAHGLDYTPTMLIASPLTADARGSAGAFPANSYWLTADATHVHVNYTTARPSGTNNLMWTILVK